MSEPFVRVIDFNAWVERHPGVVPDYRLVHIDPFNVGQCCKGKDLKVWLNQAGAKFGDCPRCNAHWLWAEDGWQRWQMFDPKG